MRPAKLAGPLLRMLSAADGGRSVIGGRAGVLAGRQLGQAEAVGDGRGERLVDVAQVGDHALADGGALDLRQLEDERR